GLDFYDRLVDEVCERNLKPFLTLYHWELPSALADRGGWSNADIGNWFAEYSNVILDRIGDRLYATAPINEPWCVAWLSHFLGLHAPGHRDIRAASRAMHHVLVAQAKAIDIIREQNAGRPGVTFNFECIEPVDTSQEAAEAAAVYDSIYNRWFLEATFQGTYPEPALRYLEPWLPSGWEKDLEKIAVPLDWFGMNYYTRTLIGPATDEALPAVSSHVGELPQTSLGWEIYPKGIKKLLHKINHTTGGKIPIYITENGMSGDDVIVNGSVDDTDRIDYLNAHFYEVKSAIVEGVPVAGYFIWSLLDNFEWAFGYEKRFGLVHVDFDTQERTPKASWYALQKALKT
ncbi:MAG: family 1 glycosylhydrolase, partial [Gammaproteobacteria bacterium]|nr:family 1 glycosylhydrolase [Gammaproteobacteria bacterium]